jgi:Uma2 family endonuclease
MPRTTHAARAGTLTFRDLWHTPDDGNRWEIIGGEVFVTPAPFVPHQQVVFRLATLLDAHVRAHRLGQVLISPITVVRATSGVQPCGVRCGAPPRHRPKRRISARRT